MRRILAVACGFITTVLVIEELFALSAGRPNLLLSAAAVVMLLVTLVCWRAR